MAVWAKTTLIEAYQAHRIDGEYFNPVYLQAENKVRQCVTDELGRLGVFVPGPFGSAFHVKNYEYKSHFRYIRGRDVKPFFLLDDDNRYIPEEDYLRLSKYSVCPGDLMISVVGTLGNVAICTEKDVPAVFSCKSTVFRAKNVEPYFLLAYLNSFYGRMCLLRRQRGAVQTGLNIEDLKAIPVPRVGRDEEGYISNLIQKARTESENSKEFLQQAQSLLESELGLDKLSFDKPASYAARFSEVALSQAISANRIDAQCFSPAALQYEHVLSTLPNVQPIRFLTAAMVKGAQQKESPDGTIPYVSIKHIQNNEIVAEGNSRRFKGIPIAKRGDLLLAITGATIGKVGIVSRYEELTFSGDMLAITTNGSIDPHYLLAFLGHRIGQVQLQRWITGSTNGHLSPHDVSRILIPRLDEKLEQRIASLMKESIDKIHESERLLEQAKHRVETLIEEAIAA